MLGQSDLKATLGIAENGSGRRLRGSTVCVYGYGPSKAPFYKEAKALKAHSEGCLLILSAPVSRGEKLLLINGTGQNPVVADIVTTRTLAAQTFEVEVAFAAPRPDFWQPLEN
jgi:hypothetical protein